MKSAHGDQVSTQLLPHAPANIEFPRIDGTSGLLAQKDGWVIPHVRGTVPTELTPLELEESVQEPDLVGEETTNQAGLPGATESGASGPSSPPSEAMPTPAPPIEVNAPAAPNEPGTPPGESQPLPSLDEILE